MPDGVVGAVPWAPTVRCLSRGREKRLRRPSHERHRLFVTTHEDLVVPE